LPAQENMEKERAKGRALWKPRLGAWPSDRCGSKGAYREIVPFITAAAAAVSRLFGGTKTLPTTSLLVAWPLRSEAKKHATGMISKCPNCCRWPAVCRLREPAEAVMVAPDSRHAPYCRHQYQRHAPNRGCRRGCPPSGVFLPPFFLHKQKEWGRRRLSGAGTGIKTAAAAANKRQRPRISSKNCKFPRFFYTLFTLIRRGYYNL